MSTLHDADKYPEPCCAVVHFAVLILMSGDHDRWWPVENISILTGN